MRRLGWIVIAIAAAVAAAPGCGNRGDTPQPPPPVTPTNDTHPTGSGNGTAPTPPNTDAPDAINDDSFELRAASGQGGYHAGQLGTFSITLRPKGHYHVNQEYPITVALTAPAAVHLAKPSLERADAAEMGERLARFDVPFTPATAGTHRVVADVDFAVCTPETCMPDRRTIALAVVVQ